jgi:hypothetical protein
MAAFRVVIELKSYHFQSGRRVNKKTGEPSHLKEGQQVCRGLFWGFGTCSFVGKASLRSDPSSGEYASREKILLPGRQRRKDRSRFEVEGQAENRPRRTDLNRTSEAAETEQRTKVCRSMLSNRKRQALARQNCSGGVHGRNRDGRGQYRRVGISDSGLRFRECRETQGRRRHGVHPGFSLGDSLIVETVQEARLHRTGALG